MRVVTIVPPAPFVTMAQAKAHLRLTDDRDDVLLGALIGAACAQIDGPDGWVARSIGAQTLEASYPRFGDVVLPCGPVGAVTSIVFVGADGVERQLTDGWRLTGDVLTRDYGRTWPSTWAANAADAVRVRYVAGGGTVDPRALQAALLMTGDMFRFRETATSDRGVVEVPMSTTVTALLTPLRLW